MKSTYILTFALVFFLLSCNLSTQDKVSEKTATQSGQAHSTYGMVASAHPLATEVGVNILEQGGNAADAAVAMSFTLAVVEPAMSGLGGRMQAIIRTKEGAIHGIDATTQAPMTYDQETAPQANYGYAVIGVPGMVAGAGKLNENYGQMPLSELIKPAIKYAAEGFYQLPQQVAKQDGVRDVLLEFKGTSQYFINPDDSMVYGPDDLFVQKDLAQTLQKIADEGTDVFYTGEIAKKIVADVAGNGGALTMESMADYEALDATVLEGSYRGNDVYGLWMPSFGAITIEILNILENFPIAELSPAERASVIYQAIQLAYEDRYRQTSLEVGEEIIRKDYAKAQAEKIIISEVPVEAQLLFDQDAPLAWTVNPGHTTHFTVVDKDGMIASVTQSIGPAMGSKVATPGLGFLYASTLGGYLGPMEPGQRAASHISPIIITKGGEPYMGLGAAGGSRIVTAIIQVVSRIIDEGMTPAEALAAPRVHPSKDGVILEMHDSLAWNSDDLLFLKKNGFVIEEEYEKFKFGRVHMIMKDRNEWIGAADPDGEGTAAGPSQLKK